MRGKGAEIVTNGIEGGGGEETIKRRVRNLLTEKSCCRGEMSLWKGLEVAGRSLDAAPDFASREVSETKFIYGSGTSREVDETVEVARGALPHGLTQRGRGGDY